MKSSEIIAIRARVQGRVQGVFYRASTLAEAERIGLVGTVQNCADGSVIIKVQGERILVEELLSWATRGPPHAHVISVKREDVAPDTNLSRFSILRSTEG